MNQTKNKPKSHRKGGSSGAVLCNVLGTLVLTLVLVVYLPLNLPLLMNCALYEITSGSMAPAIPQGSIVCVTACTPEELIPGDVIAYASGAAIPVIHRVTENHSVEGELVTKGDANAEPDLNKVAYRAVLGRMVFHLPVLGRLSGAMSTPLGKLYALGFLVVSVMFYALAGRLRDLHRDEETACEAGTENK